MQSLPDDLDNLDDKLRAELAEKIAEMRDRLGIQDFYSAHIMSTCQGQYTPSEVANGTVRQKDIHKNVTECDRTHSFNATRIVENALNHTGAKIGLDDLKWPRAIEDGIKKINQLLKVTQDLYIVAIAFIGFALLVSPVVVFLHPGRLSAWLNITLVTLAVVFITVASSFVTAVVVIGSNTINTFGPKVGVVAYRGHGFLAMTWAATALMGLATAVWIVLFCVGKRERKGREMEREEEIEVETKKHRQVRKSRIGVPWG